MVCCNLGHMEKPSICSIFSMTSFVFLPDVSFFLFTSRTLPYVIFVVTFVLTVMVIAPSTSKHFLAVAGNPKYGK